MLRWRQIKSRSADFGSKDHGIADDGSPWGKGTPFRASGLAPAGLMPSPDMAADSWSPAACEGTWMDAWSDIIQDAIPGQEIASSTTQILEPFIQHSSEGSMWRLALFSPEEWEDRMLFFGEVNFIRKFEANTLSNLCRYCSFSFCISSKVKIALLGDKDLGEHWPNPFPSGLLRFQTS